MCRNWNAIKKYYVNLSTEVAKTESHKRKCSHRMGKPKPCQKKKAFSLAAKKIMGFTACCFPRFLPNWLTGHEMAFKFAADNLCSFKLLVAVNLWSRVQLASSFGRYPAVSWTWFHPGNMLLDRGSLGQRPLWPPTHAWPMSMSMPAVHFPGISYLRPCLGASPVYINNLHISTCAFSPSHSCVSAMRECLTLLVQVFPPFHCLSVSAGVTINS